MTEKKAQRYLKEMCDKLEGEHISYIVYLSGLKEHPLASFLIEIDSNEYIEWFRKKYGKRRTCTLDYLIDLDNYRPCDCTGGASFMENPTQRDILTIIKTTK
jgi:hypothetical protein